MTQKEEPGVLKKPWKSVYKPIKLPERTSDRETTIRWSKQILEKKIMERPDTGPQILRYSESLQEDIAARKFAVRQLGKLGETDYLIKIRTKYDIDLGNAKKLLERMTSEKLQASIQLGARAYGQLRKQISDDEWEKLPKREQDSMIREADVQVVGPVMVRYDAEIRKLEDRIGVLEQVVAEIEKVLPPPTKNSLF